jgi:hypothetical protein
MACDNKKKKQQTTIFETIAQKLQQITTKIDNANNVLMNMVRSKLEQTS